MEDNNNGQDISGQNPEQPLDQSGNQNPNQYESESTYWEADNAANAADNLVPPQETPNPETATQFYQFYEQQLNGGSNTVPSTPIPMTQPPKKKSHKKLIAAVIVILLLVSIAGTAFAFQNTLLNTFASLTKSPEDYYAYVENKAFNDSVDKITPYLDFTTKNVAYQSSIDITYDRGTVDSILQGTLGMGLTDLESNLGISLDSIGIDALVASEDGNAYESLGIKLNQVDIITLEIFMKAVEQEVLLRLPELSPAYIKQSLATEGYDMNEYLTQLKLLTPERTADFLKRYGSIITDNMDKVELSKNEELTIDTLTVSCNKLTVTLDNENLYAIISAILEEAKEDEYIYDLLPIFDVSKSDYKDALDEAAASLKESLEGDTSVEGSLEMTVYVNNRGEIIGRDFIAVEDGSSIGSLGYAKLNKDNYEEFNLYLKDESGTMILDGSGNQTKDGDSYDGSAKFLISVPSSEFSTDVSLDVEYEDVKTETKDNRMYQYGTYTLSSPQAMGASLVVESDVVDDVQMNKITVQMGVSPLVSLDMKTKYLDDYSIPEISSSEETYDATEYESYLSTIDVEAYIASLSEKLGVDLQTIINNFMPYFAE